LNHTLFVNYTGWAKKIVLYLRVDNFATFNARKACNMSKVSKFCLEKVKYLHISKFNLGIPTDAIWHHIL